MKTKFFVLVALFLSFCGYAYCQCPNGNCATGGGYFYPQFFNPFGWTYWNYGYTNSNKGNPTCATCPKNGKCVNCPQQKEEVEEKAEETENVVPIPTEVPQDTPNETVAPAENGNSSIDTSPLKEEPIGEEELVVPIPPVQPLENADETQEPAEAQAEEAVVTQEEQKGSIDEAVVEEFHICPFAVRVLSLINWHRAQFGLPPLQVDGSLMVGSQNHSRYMASYGFGHAYGIGGMECIAMGVNTPESVVNMWLNSSGHRAIIMSRGTKFGFGSFGTYHTLRVR